MYCIDWHIYIYNYIYICICICICFYIYIYVYIYIVCVCVWKCREMRVYRRAVIVIEVGDSLDPHCQCHCWRVARNQRRKSLGGAQEAKQKHAKKLNVGVGMTWAQTWLCHNVQDWCRPKLSLLSYVGAMMAFGSC